METVELETAMAITVTKAVTVTATVIMAILPTAMGIIIILNTQ